MANTLKVYNVGPLNDKSNTLNYLIGSYKGTGTVYMELVDKNGDMVLEIKIDRDQVLDIVKQLIAYVK